MLERRPGADHLMALETVKLCPVCGETTPHLVSRFKSKCQRCRGRRWAERRARRDGTSLDFGFGHTWMSGLGRKGERHEPESGLTRWIDFF
jgi:ribosomal protein L33